MEERIAKFLASAGIASRRKCEELVTSRKVMVNEHWVTDLAFKVNPDKDRVLLEGNEVKPEQKLYFAVNKPKGVVCTAADEMGRASIMDLFPDVGARLYNVGRLDKDSEGLLILTNDGELCRTLTHPSCHIPKAYRVILAGKVSGTEIDKLRAGVWVDGKKVRATKAYIKKSNPKGTMVEITIEEGLNRQIRRMFGRLGFKVTKLTRIEIGKLHLGKLKEGQFRELTDREIKLLREAAEAPPKTIAKKAIRQGGNTNPAEKGTTTTKPAQKTGKKSSAASHRKGPKKAQKKRSVRLGSGTGKMSSGRKANARLRKNKG